MGAACSSRCPGCGIAGIDENTPAPERMLAMSGESNGLDAEGMPAVEKPGEERRSIETALPSLALEAAL